MRAAAVQLPVTMDLAINLSALKAALRTVSPGTLVVAPEGVLSGYEPVAGFVARLDPQRTAMAVAEMRSLAAELGVHLVAGACLFEDGAWRNAALHMGPDGTLARYDKINLARSERPDFTPGDRLPVHDAALAGEPVRLGVQMCREVRYPEQWRVLASRGAQVIAYVNNAVGSARGYAVWRAHVISRAAELQRYVVGANNAAPDQTCTSLIVAPDGEVLAEAAVGAAAVIQADLDLSAVSDWVLGQAREDLVRVVAKDDQGRLRAHGASAADA